MARTASTFMVMLADRSFGSCCRQVSGSSRCWTRCEVHLGRANSIRHLVEAGNCSCNSAPSVSETDNMVSLGCPS